MNTEEGPARWSVRMQHWTKLPKEKLTSKQRVMWGWTWNNAHSWEESEGRGPHVRKHQGQDVSPGGRICEPSQILKEVPITTPEKCGMGWKSLYTSSKLWGWNPDDNGLKKKSNCDLCFVPSFMFLLKSSQFWPLAAPSAGCCVFLKHALTFLKLLLFPGITGCFSIFPAPALEAPSSARSPGSFPWKRVFRNQDLGTKCARCSWSVVFTVFLKDLKLLNVSEGYKVKLSS